MPAWGKAGYSLIEVLVAVTLFSLTALSISAGVGRTIRTNILSANFTQATILAQDKLEELRAQSAVLGDDTDTPHPGFTRTWEITPDAPEQGVSRIDVTVSWTDDRPHTVTLTTVVNE
jgi:prepilin-type N-terminal cleavage/methylation domain-containing protein